MDLSRKAAYLLQDQMNGTYIYVSMEGVNPNTARLFMGNGAELTRVPIRDAKEVARTVFFFSEKGSLYVSMLAGIDPMWMPATSGSSGHPLARLNLAFYDFNETDKVTTFALKAA